MRVEKAKAFIVIRLLFLSIIGIFYIYYTWTSVMQKKADQAVELAKIVDAGFDYDNINNLDVTSDDINKHEYQQLKNNLIELVAVYPDIRFAYLYTAKEDDLYIMVDSEPTQSEDYSPPGQKYSEAQDVYYQAMQKDSSTLLVESKDRWGTWKSVLMPIKDTFTGEVIAVLGIDYSPEDWYSNARQNSIRACVIVVSLLLLFYTANLVMMNNKALKNEKEKLAILNGVITSQEKIFRTLYEQSPYGICFGNYEDRLININDMYAKIVGRTKEELRELGWAAITHPDDLPEDIRRYDQFIKDRIGYSMVKRYIKPDQSCVWAKLTVAPIEIDDVERYSNICLIEDITDKVKAEKDLQESERNKAMLLLNLPGMAYRCQYDKEWTMQYVSDGCYELTGYPPESLLYNKEIAFADLIPSEYNDEIRKKWYRTLKDRVPFAYEYCIITASGKRKWVFEHGQGIYDEQGKVEALEGVIIDITERKQKEDEINYLNYHDTMTGLYNRRYFEIEKQRFERENVYPISIIMGDINGLKLINDSFGHAEGDKLIVMIANILKLNCKENDIIARIGGDEFSIFLPNSTSEFADKFIRHIEADCEDFRKIAMGEAYHLSISLGCATKTTPDVMLDDVMKDAEDDMYRHKMLQSRSLHSAIISSMKSTLSEKNQETEEHAHRLIKLSNQLGRRMHLEDKQLNELELLSTLHDIGKIGISDMILKKPGKLTTEEWLEMKKHPEIGYRIARSTSELSPIAEYILSHHERWDGNGYPQGLKGDKIPLLARIIAVADAYDAMTEDRPYRKAMPKEEACEEIRRNAGTQFDPVIAELFLQEIENS